MKYLQTVALNHSVVRGYMKLMSDYPVEFGLKISKLPAVVTQNEIVDVSGGRTLSYCFLTGILVLKVNVLI